MTLSTTNKIMKALGKWAAEQGLIEKIVSASDNAEQAREYAHKAWTTAQRLEKREERARAAALSAYKSEVK